MLWRLVGRLPPRCAASRLLGSSWRRLWVQSSHPGRGRAPPHPPTQPTPTRWSSWAARPSQFLDVLHCFLTPSFFLEPLHLELNVDIYIWSACSAYFSLMITNQAESGNQNEIKDFCCCIVWPQVWHCSAINRYTCLIVTFGINPVFLFPTGALRYDTLLQSYRTSPFFESFNFHSAHATGTVAQIRATWSMQVRAAQAMHIAHASNK